MSLFVELFEHLLRQVAFQQSVHKKLSKHCPTAFVAENVAQWRHIHGNVAAVVVAAVGSSAKYCRHTLMPSAQRTCGSKQVAGNLYPTFGSG